MVCTASALVVDGGAVQVVRMQFLALGLQASRAWTWSGCMSKMRDAAAIVVD